MTPVQIPDLLRVRPSFFFSLMNVLVLESKARTSVKIEFEKTVSVFLVAYLYAVNWMDHLTAILKYAFFLRRYYI